MVSISNAQSQQHRTVKNTLIGAGIGAGTVATISAIEQKCKKDEYIKNAKHLKENQHFFNNYGEKILKDSKEGKKITEIAEKLTAGKLSLKAIAKDGALGAAFVGGLVILGNMIKTVQKEKK